MDQISVYQDIARRTGGNIYIGVVGPVRTGKSTFIKRFMETLVLPHVEDENMRERARDELPQSGSGRTIMTAEPKFVPEDSVEVVLSPGTTASVRLIDCVGYMIPGAAGQFDENGERLVTTPWFDHEIPMREAAEEGTRKVIRDHSTIGIVVTTDGSITEIPREEYLDAERRVIEELKALGKPFLILLNSTAPESEPVQTLALQLHAEYDACVLPVNCKTLSETEITQILQQVLLEFSATEIEVRIPEWLCALTDEDDTKRQLYSLLLSQAESTDRLRDTARFSEGLLGSELLSAAEIRTTDVATGKITCAIDCPRSLYYEIISRESGVTLQNDLDLIAFLSRMRSVREEYDHIREALESVRETGYGVVPPRPEELRLEEPEIVRQGGRYTVRMKAGGSSIHMLRANVVTEVHPELGGDETSGEILGFLLQGFQGDMRQLWDSNIFGKSLYEMAREGIESKVSSVPPKVAGKLQETLQKIMNDGGGTLLCIVL